MTYLKQHHQGALGGSPKVLRLSRFDTPNCAMPVPFPHTGYVEDAQRRVRVLFSGQYIVDTNKAKLV